ncbi:MAG: phospholipase D-like domain-containing protein [Patescibacteria group bacterium]
MKEHLKKILFLIIILFISLGFYHVYKSLPEGISFKGEIFKSTEEEISFLYDLTYEKDEKRIYDQKIFENVFETIDNAKKYILVDMFLWGDGSGSSERDLAQEMTDHLIDRKKEIPELKIVVITDVYNTGYGAFESSYFEQMKKEGIDVVFTNLDVLRDSNLIYSPIWRTFFQIFGESKKSWLGIPGYDKEGSIRSFARLLNFKANHRKLMLADCEDKMCSFVISANPATSGAEYSNIGIFLKNDIYKDIYQSEKAVLKMSGYLLEDWNFDFVDSESDLSADIETQFLTESKIKNSILEEINDSQEGYQIKIAIFFFSERDIIRALLEASERGVDIEIIADPSKRGFGRDKFGVPTRIVVDELFVKSGGKIKIRYYDTEEEEFHTKMITFVKGDKLVSILGSANYTRRNLNDFNLEADIKITMPLKKEISLEILEYFNKMWNNQEGNYTIEMSSFEKPSLRRQIQYRLQEFIGAGTF